MRKLQTVATVLCLVSLASGAWAMRPAAPATAMPKAEPVMNHIPAGSLGYVVVNNIDATARNVAGFLNEIGAGQMLAGMMGPPPGAGQPETAPAPPPALQPQMLLMMLKGAAKLGPGFNTNAGAAAVVLDPQQFGINLIKLLEKGIAGEEPTAEEKENLKKFPVVLFVPGASIKGVFGNYEIVTKDQEFATVKLRMGKMSAAKCGSYILLSPNAAALKAVLQARKKAADELDKSALDLIKRSDLAYQVNVKALKPVIVQAMKIIEQQMADEDEDIADLLNIYVSIYGELLSQLDGATVGIRLAKTGVVLEEVVSATPDSMIAKAFAAGAKTKGGVGVLSALPSLPYVLAAGSVSAPADEQSKAFWLEFIDRILKSKALAKLDAKIISRTKQLVADAMDQVTGMQVVAGAAPAGSGVFGVAFVVKCKDSAKVKAMLAEEASLLQTFLTTLIDDKDVKQLQIPYSKGVEKVGGISVDTIEISHPELLKMKPEEREEMRKILGEDKIRFLVAAADKNTVVITIGGSTTFMAEALKTAPGKGPISNEAGTKEVMKYMPENSTFLILFSVSNLLDVIRAGVMATTSDPQQGAAMAAAMPKLACKTPIAMGANSKGNTAHVVVYVPNALIKELVQMGMTFFMPRPVPGGPGVAPPMGDDF